MKATKLRKGQRTLPSAEESNDLLHIRARRRHPRRTQFDYLGLRCLRDDVQRALASLDGALDVLDVYCGSRPYDDLLPAGCRITGLDIVDSYGVADVVSDEFLPFDDESFDLIVCYQAFYFVHDDVAAVAELRRVVREGGTVVVTVPFATEYDPTILEHRYTGPEFAALFADWDDVQIVDNGGRAVTWTMTTARLVQGMERRLPPLIRKVFPAIYVALNSFGSMLHRREDENGLGAMVFPHNLLLTARRPTGLEAT